MGQKYGKRVRLLFAAEIAGLIGVILTAFVIKAAWCGVVGLIISIIAAIVSLVAVIKLRKANTYFKRSFSFVIANIVITIAALIFGAIVAAKSIEGLFGVIVALGVINALKLINSIIVVNNIVHGCKELVIAEKKDANFGQNSIKIYGICMSVAVILTILLIIPQISENDAANSALSAIISVCATIAGVIYIITLGRTAKRLKE